MSTALLEPASAATFVRADRLARAPRDRRATIAALIVTHDRLALLRRAIEATLAQDVDAVLVVDNASSDGTAAWLASIDDPRLRVERLADNRGGAGGFEHGMRRLCADPSIDWMVCFDDDAHPQRDAIAAFRAAVVPDDVGAVAAAVYLPDGRICEMNRPSCNPFATLGRVLRLAVGSGRSAFHIRDEAYARATPIDVECTSFVGYFLRAAVARSIGYPRGELFIYADDVLYSYAVTCSGARTWFLPGVRFVHDCASVAGDRPVYLPLWKAYYTYRNGLIMYRRFAGWLFAPVAVAKLMTWALRARRYPSRAAYLRVLLAAAGDGLAGRLGRRFDEVRRLAEDAA
ncbi:MAG TPA: glycosyltransferase [Planctomycetota bacterium]|nr:glycosyltransferase [Planctomycetota bacterium]